MDRGYIKLWRKTLDTDIWQMNPLYWKVWSYILMSVNWETKLIPTKKNTPMWVSCGSLVTSIQKIADRVSHFDYGVQKTPNKKTISEILQWLQANNMIQVESNDLGTVIFVINWDTYNNTPEEKVTKKKRLLDTTKELIEVIEVKEYIINKELYNKKQKENPDGFFVLPSGVSLKTWKDFEKMRAKQKSPLTSGAVKLAIEELEKAPERERQKMVEQSILNGWKGIFPLKAALKGKDDWRNIG